ncbi:hypothetical protein LA080_006651 [Diaporthe eres]|nr:hypothetical protein LA080_006651 [Diaporthe eres]
MCLQPNSQTAKKVSTPAALKFPKPFTPGYGQGKAGKGPKGIPSQPELCPDPMIRWLLEPPGTGPWHGFDAPAYSRQKDVSHSKHRPAMPSSTGATAGGEKKGAEGR